MTSTLESLDPLNVAATSQRQDRCSLRSFLEGAVEQEIPLNEEHWEGGVLGGRSSGREDHWEELGYLAQRPRHKHL